MDWGEGGGFINDSISEEPQQQVQGVNMGGDDKNKLIAAVSVSQIAKLTRPQEGLIIHGKKIYHINLVAYVYEIVDVNPTKIHVMVDDHSGGGPLEVSHILGDAGIAAGDSNLSMFDVHSNNGAGDRVDTEQPRDIHSLRAGDYVRCIGVVKFNNDKANIVAYHLRIIEDPNEITMHILEVIRDSLYYQKVQANGGALPVAKEEKPQAQSFQQQQSHQSDFGKLSTRDKHLITFLKSKAGETGLHIDEICRNFSAFKRNEVLDSLQMLSNEGLCWQSDDENVWCVE